MTAEEFVHLIIVHDPIVPMDDHNECRFCRTSWAEDTFPEWVSREARGATSGHHDRNCIWVVANQVEL